MDNCAGCIALIAESGNHAEFYSRKLLERGWAGSTSPAEKLYLRHHAPSRATRTQMGRFAPKPSVQMGVIRKGGPLEPDCIKAA